LQKGASYYRIAKTEEPGFEIDRTSFGNRKDQVLNWTDYILRWQDKVARSARLLVTPQSCKMVDNQ
jgi:hypothetical protein